MLQSFALEDCNLRLERLASLLKGCKNLRRLELVDERLDDAATEALGANCPLLEGLLLLSNNARNFTTAGIARVAVRYGKTLRYLSLGFMNQLGEPALRAIAQFCRHLEQLELRWCHDLSTDGLVRLMSSLPQLRELVLEGCTPVKDAVLTAIATHAPHLTLLHLAGSDGYTRTGAQAVVRSLRDLRCFVVYEEDRAFTTKLLVRWLNSLPGLRITHARDTVVSYFKLDWAVQFGFNFDFDPDF